MIQTSSNHQEGIKNRHEGYIIVFFRNNLCGSKKRVQGKDTRKKQYLDKKVWCSMKSPECGAGLGKNNSGRKKPKTNKKNQDIFVFDVKNHP